MLDVNILVGYVPGRNVPSMAEPSCASTKTTLEPSSLVTGHAAAPEEADVQRRHHRSRPYRHLGELVSLWM
jgi:hypothetical protein